MTINPKNKYEQYFSGTIEESRARFPESIVDKAIEILSLDPDTIFSPKAPPSLQTVKENLWDDIIKVIWRWGKPSPTELETTPTKLKNHATKLKKQLQDTLDTLSNLQYAPLLEKGTMTKEFIVANRIRQKSEIMRANSTGKPGQFVSSLIVKQEHEREGEWGKYCPFDHELPQTIESLEKLTSYIDGVLEDTSKEIKSTGTNKKTKENQDLLTWALCHIYKKYTEEIPTSSTREDGTATGKIIPFLQLILPETSYPNELTDWALEKRIRVLKSHPRHGSLWQDAKD